MKTQRAMAAALTGWRGKFADAVQEPLSRRTPLNVQQIRAILGVLFFMKSALYVGRAVRRALRER